MSKVGTFLYYLARVVCVMVGLPFVIAMGAFLAVVMLPICVYKTVEWGFTGRWEFD